MTESQPDSKRASILAGPRRAVGKTSNLLELGFTRSDISQRLVVSDGEGVKLKHRAAARFSASTGHRHLQAAALGEASRVPDMELLQASGSATATSLPGRRHRRGEAIRRDLEFRRAHVK